MHGRENKESVRKLRKKRAEISADAEMKTHLRKRRCEFRVGLLEIEDFRLHITNEKKEKEQDGKDTAIKLASCPEYFGICKSGSFSKVRLQQSMIVLLKEVAAIIHLQGIADEGYSIWKEVIEGEIKQTLLVTDTA